MTFPVPGDGPLLVRDPRTASWRSTAEAAGWSLVESGCPDEPWNLEGTLVCTGDPTAAAMAVLRGGGAALVADIPEEQLDLLLADVQRVGGRVLSTVSVADTTTDTDVLLSALVEGESVGRAARQAHMSLRTAQRRLDALRKAYGVTTTAAVVAIWTRERRQMDGGR